VLIEILPKCKQSYNFVFCIAQVTGEDLIRRSDDTEEKLTKRMEVYDQQTKPVVDYYYRKNILSNVDADKPPEKVGIAVMQNIFTNIRQRMRVSLPTSSAEDS
jgi:adenylate kinase family enzyme